jgi:hypothetical protein
MKFRIYNIQLLPLSPKSSSEAGKQRYLDLFNSFNEVVTTCIKERRLVAEAKPLINDSYFAALNCAKYSHIEVRKSERIKHEFIVGRFIKFHQAGEVEDLYTKATLFKAQTGQNAVANRKEFIYIFDPVSHWIAIEEQGGRLPNHKAVQNALEQYLRPVAEIIFPDYTLTINLVSRSDELNSVLERAVGFSKIEVDITYKNGPTQDEVLSDMAANRLHRLRLTASSSRGSHMPKVPETINGIVRNAAQYGEASITYLESTDSGGTRIARYESDANPETIAVHSKKNEDPISLYSRITLKIKDLAKRLGHLGNSDNDQ